MSPIACWSRAIAISGMAVAFPIANRIGSDHRRGVELFPESPRKSSRCCLAERFW